MSRYFLVYKSLQASCIALTLGGFVACSPQKPAAASVAAATYQVKMANQSAAPRYAPRELAQAQEKLRLAERAVEERNFVVARRLGEQASVDASYAIAKSEADRSIVSALKSYPAIK